MGLVECCKLSCSSGKHAQLLQVGFSKVIGLPGDYSYQWKERQLMVMIAAEGPTCVLTIIDLQVSIFHPAHANCVTGSLGIFTHSF